jgi:hypothetical protein
MLAIAAFASFVQVVALATRLSFVSSSHTWLEAGLTRG